MSHDIAIKESPQVLNGALMVSVFKRKPVQTL